MARGRAWRRYKNYTKAKRKRDIDKAKTRPWVSPDEIEDYLWYRHLHQYSKGKIHCSCPMCRAKTKRNDYYVVGHSYTMADLRKMMRMAASEEEYYGEKLECDN